jgi:RND family efflux transporter MFP subunit
MLFGAVMRMSSRTPNAIAAICAAWLVCTAAAAQAPAVPTAAVGALATAGALQIDGSLQPVRQSTVAAQVSGNVLQLAVKAGDRVKSGQLLARIDDRDAQAGLARGDAGVAQAEANWRNARLNAERTRDLRAQGFVSQAALDVAETQRDAARAGLQQAQAERSQAALTRGYASVVAPFDAIVQTTQVEVGDLATAGRPLVTLYAPGQMRAVVQLPASQSALARAAQKVEVQLPDGRWVAPATRTDLPIADAVSQTVEWRLDLSPALSAGLLPGQAVRVRFEGAPAAAGTTARLVVPPAAVLRRGELTAVYVVQGSQFVLKAVRLGADRGAAGVEVVAGLKAGERIALDAVRAGLSGVTVQ